MATTKLQFLSLLLVTLILTIISAEQVVHVETTGASDAVPQPEVAESSIRLELDQLKSKISLLESSIGEKTHELEAKSEHIKQLERIVEEKSTNLASLQKEIKSFKEKGTLDTKQLIDKADARASVLEKQINNLRREIEGQEKKKDALESRTSLAEKKIQELNLKLESLQKINEEQKSRIRKTERALQAAEEEMMKAKMEAALFSKQLSEVHEAWVPHWLIVHYIHCQSLIKTYWNNHGRPALDSMVDKALEKKALLEKAVQPHVERFKTKWVPIIKERSSALASDIGPHLRSLNDKAVNIYYVSKSAAEPHIMKAREVIDPYYQEAKKFATPYVDQISSATKPHLDKMHVFLRPYTKKMVRTSKKYSKTVTAYHRQVASTVRESLKQYEITKSLATAEFAYYTAAALMALPVIICINWISGCFRKKPRRRTRNSHSSHTRRRGKRVHPDK